MHAQKTMEKLACLEPAQFPLTPEPTALNEARQANSVVMTLIVLIPDISIRHSGALNNRPGFLSPGGSMCLQHQVNLVVNLKLPIPPRLLLATLNKVLATKTCLSWFPIPIFLCMECLK